MALSSDFLYELHRRNDIVEVVSRDVALKKRGRTHTGLCPFHNEKTPSFVVYPDTQSFYCFGCSAGGDIIAYVKLRENIGYIEAVRLLAERAGLAMPSEQDDGASKRKVSILAANKAAARFFFESLNSDGGKEARGYLRGRGLSDNTIKRFGIGYAPNEWQALCDALKSAGIREEALLESGLCGRSRHGGLYDRFRNRLMFPIIDLRGNVVGFGGRRLNEQDTPKYINTNETPVYKKSRVLYGLNLAKSNASRTIILTEGYMDTVSLHQAGFTNAVASCGTAITDEHARMISQYADEVVISYDGDEAGRAATRRAMDTLRPTGLLVRVLDFKGAKDPDEFIRKNGVIAFETLLKGSDTSIEYELSRAKLSLDLNTQAGKVEYLKRAAEILSRCSNATETEIYAARVATEVDISKNSVLNHVESVRRAVQKKTEKAKQEKLIGNIQTEYRALRDKQEDGTVGTAFARLQLIAMLCLNPDFCKSVSPILSPRDFGSEELGGAFSAICELSASSSFAGFSSISGELSSETCASIARFFAKLEGVNSTADDAVFLAEKIKNRPPSQDELKLLSDEELMRIIKQRKQGE